MDRVKVKEDCIITELFTDAVDPEFCRMEYCKKNCNYRCLTGRPYKKRSDYNE